MIPYILRELPAEQRQALALNVKTPLVYTNVLVRNWQPWVELGISAVSAPMSFFERVALDFPVSLGGYRHPREPGAPILLHLEHVPGAPNSGLDARAQFRIGREKLLHMTFADFEARIRDELDRMLGPGGFSSARDIAAITVNRWAHGYGYVANSLFDPDDYGEVVKLARQPSGRIASPIQMPQEMHTPISRSTRRHVRSASFSARQKDAADVGWAKRRVGESRIRKDVLSAACPRVGMAHRSRDAPLPTLPRCSLL
jgi:hypothetical protein